MFVWLSSRVRPRLKNRGTRVFALVQISFFVLQSEHAWIPMPSISICDICGWRLVSNTRSIGAIVCKNLKAFSIIFYFPSASNHTTIAKDFDFCWHHLRGRNCSTARSTKWRDLSSVQRSGRLWQLWNFGGGSLFEVTRTFCQCTRVLWCPLSFCTTSNGVLAVHLLEAIVSSNRTSQTAWCQDTCKDTPTYIAVTNRSLIAILKRSSSAFIIPLLDDCNKQPWITVTVAVV